MGTYGLSKPTGNVGQQRNHNRYNKERQFILMESLNIIILLILK